MPKLEAYLSIEETVGATLYKGWRKRGLAIVDRLEAALKDQKFNDAYAAIKDMTLRGAVEDKKPHLDQLGVSAMLFGASHIVPTKYTQLSKSKKLPEELELAISQLQVMVEENGSDVLTRRVTKLVQAEEDAASSAMYETKKAEFNLADALNNAVMGTGKAVFDVGANLTTSRLVSFGFLDEAVFNQITTYQVTEVLDNLTCPVCRVMHGKTFDVVKEHSRMLTVLRIQDPNELKSAAPWPKQDKASVASLKGMSPEDMQDAGFGTPPYHPGCRGILQIAGTVTENIMPVLPPVPLISQLLPADPPLKVPTGASSASKLLVTMGYDVSKFTEDQLAAIRILIDEGTSIEAAVNQVLAST